MKQFNSFFRDAYMSNFESLCARMFYFLPDDVFPNIYDTLKSKMMSPISDIYQTQIRLNNNEL